MLSREIGQTHRRGSEASRFLETEGCRKKAPPKPWSTPGRGLECCSPRGIVEKLASYTGLLWSSLYPRVQRWTEVTVLFLLERQSWECRALDPRASKWTKLAIPLFPPGTRGSEEGTGQRDLYCLWALCKLCRSMHPYLPQEHLGQCGLGGLRLVTRGEPLALEIWPLPYFFPCLCFSPVRGGASREQRPHRINSSN